MTLLKRNKIGNWFLQLLIQINDKASQYAVISGAPLRNQSKTSTTPAASLLIVLQRTSHLSRMQLAVSR